MVGRLGNLRYDSAIAIVCRAITVDGGGHGAVPLTPPMDGLMEVCAIQVMMCAA